MIILLARFTPIRLVLTLELLWPIRGLLDLEIELDIKEPHFGAHDPCDLQPADPAQKPLVTWRPNPRPAVGEP